MNAAKMHETFERRVEKRTACSEEIFFVTQNQFYDGQLKDYGRNGLFIKTKVLLPVDEIITVIDPHPDGKNKKRKGQILWSKGEGFEVELFRSRDSWEGGVQRFEQRIINSIL